MQAPRYLADELLTSGINIRDRFSPFDTMASTCTSMEGQRTTSTPVSKPKSANLTVGEEITLITAVQVRYERLYGSVKDVFSWKEARATSWDEVAAEITA